VAENHWDDPEKITDDAQQALDKVRAEGTGREWRLLEKIVGGLHVEQRRARRWGIFFKLLTFTYLFALLALFFIKSDMSPDVSESAEHTAIIEVLGPISAKDEASADNIVWSLRRAFKEPSAKAVILRINSPGGSPVQSGYIYDEIKRLRALNPQKKLYAVISDIGASGAYYIAAAADEIYADKASLVGSIGVTASGFGFVDLMTKLGVERRIYTAGEHKAFLDPFSPSDARESQLWQEVLNTTHRQFIEQVRAGRGERLKDDPKLFTGLVWTGEQALEMGLIDGLGSSSYVARELIGVEKLVDYMPQPKPWEEIIDQLGVSFAKGMATAMGVDAAASPVNLR